MSVIQSYPFNDQADYNVSNTQVTGGLAKLALATEAGNVFNEAFAADTGFTYNSALAEFTAGLLRAKDQRPSAQTFFATFNLGTMNANWGYGSLVATNNGATLISGGIEMLGAAGQKYVDFVATSNASSLQTGCIRLKVKPNYSGAPTTDQHFLSISQAIGSINNRIGFYHTNTSGNFALKINSDTGVAIVNQNSLGVWSPVAGTTYEIELNFDITTGATRLFINGVQLGATQANTGTRSGAVALLRSGEIYSAGGNNSNFTLENLSYFSAVQHTANYTPGAEPSSYIYATSKVDLPNFAHAGVGFVTALTLLAVTEVGSPQYIIEGQYWNGSAWAASDGSYAQSNPLATVNTNIATLALASQTVISVSVTFPDSNTLASVDALVLTYTKNIYPASGYLEPIVGLDISEIVDYSQSAVTPAGTSVKIILKLDGVLKYWNGSAWVLSNGSEAQSNTAAEVTANVGSLVLGSNSELFVRWLLFTTDEDATAEISEAIVEYEFGAVETDPVTCIVYGYYRDIAGNPIAGAIVTFSLVRAKKEYTEANKNIIEGSVSVTTNSIGYFQTPLIRTSEYDTGAGQYKVEIKKSSASYLTSKNPDKSALTFDVPDASTKDITDLLPTV